MLYYRLRTLFFFLFLSFSINLYAQDSIKIVIYGDTQNQNYTHDSLMRLIAKDSPNYIFHLGDIVERGNSEKQWMSFDTIINKRNPNSKFYAIKGNHDFFCKERLDCYSADRKHYWFTEKILNTQFIFIDNSNIKRNSEKQFLWIDSVLFSGKQNKYVQIICMHRPLYSNGKHWIKKGKYRKKMLDLIEKYKVDAVFAGHNHSYERMVRKKTMYITSGGGGGKLVEKKGSLPESDIYKKTHHYILLNIEPTYITAEVFDINSKSIDKFKIEKKYEPE